MIARNKCKRWTADEEEYLKLNWGIVSVKLMAEKFGRSKDGIYRKATRFKLKMTDEQYENLTQKTRWTDDMKDYLRENYGTTPLEQIMEHLQVFNKDRIRKQASILNIAEEYHEWSDDEINYLNDNWGEVSTKHMANKFGLSVAAVIQKANRLNLGNQLYYSGDWYSIPTLTEMIGVPKRTLYEWINKGKLQSKKLSVGKTHRVRVKYTNLIEFLKSNKDLYDARNCDSEMVQALLGKHFITKNNSVVVRDIPDWWRDKVDEDSKKPAKYVPKGWTKMEEKRLLETYKGKTAAELGKQFERSINSIREKIRQFKEKGLIK